MGCRLAIVGAALLGLAATGCNGFDFHFNFDFYDAGPSNTWYPTCTVECCSCDCETPSTGSDGGVLPPRPSGLPRTGAGHDVLAVSRLHFGDSDRGGHESGDAWKRYGLNIDGKVTGAGSKDVCTRIAGSSCSVQLDGDNGIDNSFGANVLPIFTFFDSTLASDANAALQQGDATLLVELDGLGPGSTWPVPGALYRALPTTHPKWDGTDVRDVDVVSLVGGSGLSPAAVLGGGYVVDGTWVGQPPVAATYLDMDIKMGASVLPPLPIRHVQLAMQVAPGGGSAVSGTLAGVVRTADFVAWFRSWAGGISTSLCLGSAFESIATQIEQTSDILADGTNEPGRTCDGISVGLGFDATAVRLGQRGTAPATVDPCADAGDGGGGDGGIDASDGGG